MSDYIFKPPPPPPPKAVAPASTSNQRSDNPRGGGRSSQPNSGVRGRGGNNNGFQGRGGRGGYSQQNNIQYPQQQFQLPQQQQQFPLSAPPHVYSQQNHFLQQQQQFQPPSAPAPAPHLNPAFFPQFHQSPTSVSQYQLPPAVPLQVSSINPFFPQWTNTPAAPAMPAYQSSMPTLRSYSDLHTPSAPSSYGHFSAPVPPPPPSKKKQRPTKPDMSQEEWFALNGGKLLGTNIKPPETVEEIEAWIAERKARYPSAKRREQNEREQEERRKKAQQRIKEEEEKLRLAREEKKARKEEAAERLRKHAEKKDERRKRRLEDSGDAAMEESDSAPEEISAHIRTVFRDDRKKQTAPKSAGLCKAFQNTGSCPRSDRCQYQHVEKRENKKSKGAAQKQQGEKKRPSLYQRLVEKEMDHENEVMLQVIKFLVEMGALKGVESEGEAVKASDDGIGTEGEDEEEVEEGVALSAIVEPRNVEEAAVES